MKDKSQGFSLLEVTLILLIMSLVAVAAVPSMKNIRKQEVNQFAKVLALDLVEQRGKQKVNAELKFHLEFLSDHGGTFYGYQIKDVEDELNPQIYKTQYGETKNLKVTILDAEGNQPDVPIQTLCFNKDTLKSLELPEQDYTQSLLKIQIEQDSCKVILEFDYLIGRYELIEA